MWHQYTSAVDIPSSSAGTHPHAPQNHGRGASIPRRNVGAYLSNWIHQNSPWEFVKRITAPMTERGQVNFPSRSGRSLASVHRLVRDSASLPTLKGRTLSVRRPRIAKTTPSIFCALWICLAKNSSATLSCKIAPMQPMPNML